jgi:hypothetical protein
VAGPNHRRLRWFAIGSGVNRDRWQSLIQSDWIIFHFSLVIFHLSFAGFVSRCFVSLRGSFVD